MPHLVVLATGGTIASRSGAAGAPGAGTAGAGGAVATDTAADLLGGTAPLDPAITFEAVDVLRKNSFNLTMADLRDIAAEVARQLGVQPSCKCSR